MIGGMGLHNDWYIIFERDEIEKLETQIIEGIRIDEPGKIIGKFEMSIESELCKSKLQSITFEFGDVTIASITDDIYQRLKKKHRVETHEGFRHTHLIDANYLGMYDESYYQYLISIRDKN